jgi:hypothetical protein
MDMNAISTGLDAQTMAPIGSLPGRAIIPVRKSFARPLEVGDLDDVARLFLQRFRKVNAGVNSRTRLKVAEHLRQLYLEGPCSGRESDSLVQMNARGELAAFIGVNRFKFLLDGGPVTVGVTGSLMAATNADSRLTAVHLLQALHRLPFDVIYTDSANRHALAIGQAMKYRAVTPESLEWACLHRPASVAVHKIKQRFPWAPVVLARAFARGVDALAIRAIRRQEDSRLPLDWRDEEVTAADFIAEAPETFEDYRLRPSLSRLDLAWIVTMASLSESAGRLTLRIIRDAEGKAVASYAFHGDGERVARVFHAVARDGAWGALLASVIETTSSMGCIGVHGCVRPGFFPHIYRHRGLILYHAMGTMHRSDRADIVEAINGGASFLGGLAGDRWSPLALDDFR